MTITKAIVGLMSVAALTIVATGATLAQTFQYTDQFTPNLVTGNGGVGNFVEVTSNTSIPVTAPSQISLNNFVEFSNTSSPDMVTFSQAFTDAITITPTGGTAMTQDLTGTFSGTFNTTQTSTQLTFDGPTTLVYNFGSLGTYTLSDLSFSPPGVGGSQTAGALGAVVTYSSPVPEASTTVSLGLMLVLGGLAFAAKRKKANA